ncbi:uncharacterized protein Z520_07079 [Fonsecaea multimorphosa CBS 102226]|uniref:GH16 domain-containing protein n=1 Tax=Fonsecaea multimorphosa CBS 102226 TaxID=1442371 RepID=A0A0D2H570_9EURO|nr:uncharacterized protein Z520_07079 [Fonsecaea multimorphosa CBS 102226]KIX96965.1 hypothetical protein Z520_07079 [Fonsecaea multimorphosa CBS 102226]OAL23042.1 hypothetical protein AYO22_06656 [Fonsecaea multimorphosa]
MPFKDALAHFKAQIKDLQQEGQKILSGGSGSGGGQQQQQSQYHQPPPQQYPGAQQHQQPPPIPESTRPNQQFPAQQGQSLQPTIYWRARLDPGTPVSAEWEHKLGNNNGWGNNEMEHYTAEGENSFFTPNNLLVLRAISTPNHPDPAKKYTSARLVSRQRLSRSRGSLVATLTLPCAGGIWPAFWLLPFEPFTWPTDGEVDIAETWNGDGVNHSCLHWGFYTPQDTNKHRVVATPVQGMNAGRPVRFEFAWMQGQGQRGRMVWWIDGQAVMKAPIPAGTRPMADFVVLLNIAMGGNVCAGRIPAQGTYDMVVHEMKMMEEPEAGGWARFERDWSWVREGNTI